LAFDKHVISARQVGALTSVLSLPELADPARTLACCAAEAWQIVVIKTMVIAVIIAIKIFWQTTALFLVRATIKTIRFTRTDLCGGGAEQCASLPPQPNDSRTSRLRLTL
jgi:hypothetical protein